jgi:hypothetical protein
MVPESKTGALAIDWEMVGIHPLGSELGHMFTRHLIKAESIQEWEERIGFFLPEMIGIGQMTESEAFAMLYWGTLADACVLHSAEVEVDKDLVIEGLQLFV